MVYSAWNRGAAFTDHYNQRGAIAAKKFVNENQLDFEVYIAEEWTNMDNGLHLNLFGLDESIVPGDTQVPDGPKAMNAEDTIKYVKENDGYVIVNHYSRDEYERVDIERPYTIEQLAKWGVDGFAVAKCSSDDYVDIYDYCLTHKNSLNESLILLGGSDIHSNRELDKIIKLQLDDPDDLSLDNIFKNLRRNNHRIIYIDLYPKRVDLPELITGIGSEKVEDFLNYFLNLDSFQLLSWIIWSCGGYFMFTLIYIKIKKTDLEYLREKIL